MKSNLRMESFYFNECLIKRELKVSDGQYNVDLQRKIDKLQEHIYNIELTLTIKKDDLYLFIKATAKFIFESDSYEIEDKIIKNNTTAIMFPFLRSQVSLLTTQPGMSPILLPPINATKLVDE